ELGKATSRIPINIALLRSERHRVMTSPKTHLNRRVISLAIYLTLCSVLFWWNSGEASRYRGQAVAGLSPVHLHLQFQGRGENGSPLTGAGPSGFSVVLPRPPSFPRQGGVGVRWTFFEAEKNGGAMPPPSSLLARQPDAFGIYTKPTADWKKVLHALDSDL